MRLKITSMGNAGVKLENAAGTVYIDAFFQEAPGVGGKPFSSGAEAGRADLILITHPHRDHLDPEQTLIAAETSGAAVAGPARAIRHFQGALPADRLVVLEPEEGRKPPASARTRIGDVDVTAFRTYHGRDHNSYLIDMGGVRILHDADNESTQPLDLAAIGRVDLLLLCPWAGSGAGGFVAALKPGKWLLIHMTSEEIAQHRRETFLPPLVNPVPEGVLALAPGETTEL